MSIVSEQIQNADAAFSAVRDFHSNSRYAAKRKDPSISDFTFGNPHEMPLAPLVSAIRDQAVPQDKDWFAYKTSEEEPRAVMAARISSEYGMTQEPEDVALTTGAFAAIMVAFRLVLEPGDEVVYSEPAWFCYEPMLHAANAVPRKVQLKEPSFDLDLEAIEAAIGPKTRMVIVNTPHNPTGRIYGPATLRALADILQRASARYGRRIFLLSDEPYRQIRLNGRRFVSPAAIYPWTLVSYSFGKVTLAPGQRLGYLAPSPMMPRADREELRNVMFSAQMSLGWCFPNAVMQHALPEIASVSIDIDAIARRRDILMRTLTEAGFDVLEPQGTFYLWVRWPEGDPDQLWDALADRNVFVMPGKMMNAPNYFRISLTASDEMVQRALPAFRAIGRQSEVFHAAEPAARRHTQAAMERSGQLRRVHSMQGREGTQATRYQADGSRKSVGTRIGGLRSRWISRRVQNGRVRLMGV